MQIKRFTAADMRRALELVRQELGDDAVILSSSKKGNSVEILATDENCEQWLRSETDSNSDLQDQNKSVFSKYEGISDPASLALVDAPNNSDNPPTGSEPEKDAKELPNPYDNRPRFDEVLEQSIAQRKPRGGLSVDGKSKVRAISEKMALSETIDVTRAESLTPASHNQDTIHHSDRQIAALQDELQNMRELLEMQLSQSRFAALKGHHLAADRRLQNMGFCDQFRTEFQAQCDLSAAKDQAEAWRMTMAYLTQQIKTSQYDVLNSGGQIALIGPTGAGKTTTIAKLATEYVLKHGRESLSLVTIDNERLGAQSQLKSLSQILQVPLRIVSSPEQLNETLASLSYSRLVLIDTPGVNGLTAKNDPMIKAVLASPAIAKLVVLAANSQYRFQQHLLNTLADDTLRAAIITKLDETECLGETLDALIASGLEIMYTADGQNIPDDFSKAKAHNLVATAVSVLTRKNSKAASLQSATSSKSA